MKFFFILFLLPVLVFAQASRPIATIDEHNLRLPGEAPAQDAESFETVVEEAQPLALEEVSVSTQRKARRGSSRDHRDESDHTMLLGYQLVTSWLPSKFAFSYAYVMSEKWSAEFEYSWAKLSTPFIGVDLGSITERRYSLFARRYLGNSFNFTLGAFFQDFKAQASGRILGAGYDVATFGAEGWGITTGIGNRWQFSNGITLGVDWLRLNVPLVTTKTENEILKDINDQSDRDDVKDIIRTFNRIPTFVVFGLHVGYTF